MIEIHSLKEIKYEKAIWIAFYYIINICYAG